MAEVIAYLATKEVENLDDIKRLTAKELDDMLMGITPEGRRGKVREVLAPIICM